MNEHHDGIGAALLKVGVAWVGWLGGIKLSDMVLFATLIYTILQIFFLIKNRGRK